MLAQPQSPNESAGSSPTKSPKKPAALPNPGVFSFGGSTSFVTAKTSPVKKPASPVKQSHQDGTSLPAPAFLPGLPAPSDPLPNLRDSQEMSTNNTEGWQIPAIRPEEPESLLQREPLLAAGLKPLPPSPHKPGAAAKIGRRQAWLKFMAYEGAVQICLDSVLQGSSSAPATGFLLNGCKDLKEALSLGMLLLPAAGFSQRNDTAIYWDDREEGGGAVLERITLHENKMFEDPSASQARHQSPPPRSVAPPPAAPAAPPLPANFGMTPLANAQQAQHAQQHTPTAVSIGPRNTSMDSLVPVIEATVVRVVGCPFVTGGDLRRSRASSLQERSLAVVMHPAGTPTPEDPRNWTTVTPSGATENPGVLRLQTDVPRGTVVVELYSSDRQVAAGTVQAGELQRCAMQHDGLDEEAPMGAGFLRNLMPAFGRRKDVAMRGDGGSTSSMTWVRLVDGDGADAGHVVVAAKIITTSEAATSISYGTPSPGSVSAPTPPPPPSRAAATSSMTTNALARAEDLSNDFQHLEMNATRHRQRKFHSNAATGAAASSEGGRSMPPPASQLQHPVEVVRVDFRGAGIGGRANTSGGYLRVNSQHVYDVLLESGLTAAGCGPQKLTLSGPWAWLVQQYAERYGVRKQYATLAYLRWVVRTDNAAPTANCLGTLAAQLGPLLDERDSVALTSAELALLGHVVERVDQLLVSCFENYFALCEESAGGLADGMLSVRGAGAPPALRPAVELLSMTRGVEPGPDSGITWLTSRLRSAARKRFQALLAATEARRGPDKHRRGGPNLSAPAGAAAASNELDDPAMSWAYTRVDELCSCVINELRADESIAAAKVLPAALSLPQVTSVEYIRGTISYLHHVLEHYPPPSPSPAAVRLVESVGRLQSFVERHRLDDAATRLNSKDIFGGFVSEWVAGTACTLRRTLKALDRSGPPALSGWADLQTGVKTRVSPLIEGMLAEVEAEMRLYARIVAYWPAHGQELESTLVSVLREATASASAQCGLVQSKVDDSVPLPVAGDRQQPIYMHSTGAKMQKALDGKKFGRVAWRWIQVGSQNAGAFSDAPAALRRGINPHQALLLNSLRRLLAVIPQMELALRGWCSGTGEASDPRQSVAAGFANEDRSARDAPDLGAHWAQLVKEVRTEYYACCTLTVESLAGELSKASATSVVGVLRREAMAAQPAAVAKQLRKVLDQTAPNLRWLAAALDGRVFVALARGLWDNAAKDVLRFAEDLTDGGASGTAQGAWRARQGAGAALRCLDAFYRTELASAMGSDLLDRDLTPPQHAQRAAALLADNTEEINMSFDVY